MTGFAALPLGTRLLGVKKAIGSAFRWVTASAAHILAVAAVLALLWGFYERHEDAKHIRALQACDAARKADEAQWNRQVAAAKAATAKAEQDGKDAAHDADTYHTQLVNTTDAFDRWRAAHRVQPNAASPPIASSPGSNQPAYIPPQPPAVPAVELPASDLDNWKANADYAMSCYAWGRELVGKGLAH